MMLYTLYLKIWCLIKNQKKQTRMAKMYTKSALFDTISPKIKYLLTPNPLYATLADYPASSRKT